MPSKEQTKWRAGIAVLGNLLQEAGRTPDNNRLLDLLGWARQLEEISEDERRFGVLGSDSREQRERLYRELNRLALDLTQQGFSDVCRGDAVAWSVPELSIKDTMARVTQTYDIALSFSGCDRVTIEPFARQLIQGGLSVFYDRDEYARNWGRDLALLLHEIYSKRARHVIIFVSQHYLDQPWTIHELRSALECMIQSRRDDYILAVQLENVRLPGLPASSVYMPIGLGIDAICQMAHEKLKHEGREARGE